MSDTRKMVQRWEPLRDQTVQALVDWCLQHDLDPAAVSVTGASIRWEGPQTDEEYERVQAHERATAERHERWERDTYEKLRLKYGEGAERTESGS